MKKNFLILFCCLGAALGSKAQLASTSWKGNVLAPELTPVTLRFKADILDVVITANGNMLESMSYRISQDSLFLKKVSGGSPCDTTVAGKYLWKVTGDNLSVTPLSDECSARLQAWPKTPFARARE